MRTAMLTKLLLISAAGFIVACKPVSPEELARIGKERRAVAAKASARLSAAWTGFRQLPAGEQKCPDAEINAVLAQDENAARILTAQWETLEPHASGAEAAAFAANPYQLLTDVLILHLPAPAQLPVGDGDNVVWKLKDPAWRAGEILKTRYMAVFRATSAPIPVMGKDRNMYEEGGQWHGWMGLFDSAANRYVCFLDLTSYSVESVVLRNGDDEESFVRDAAGLVVQEVFDAVRQNLSRVTRQRLRIGY